MSTKSICSAATISVVLLGSLIPAVSFAQDLTGVKITPSIIEELAGEGFVKDYSVKVENEGAVPLTLYPRVRDIIGMDEGGRPIFAKDGETSEYGLSSWITFKESVIELAPRGGGTLNFTVRVPTGASPGAHVGSIIAGTKAPGDVRIGSAVNFEVGSILSLRVPGEIVEDVELREFSIERLFYDEPVVVFTTRVENLGNVFARPRGFIDITNMFGKKVDTVVVNEGGASVFPKSERSFSATWDPASFHLGKYTAELSLSVEGQLGVETLISEVEFWVIPLDVALPVLGGLLVLLITLYVLLRLYVRKEVRRATGGRGGALRSEAASLSRASVVVIALLVSIMVALVLLLVVFG